MYDCFHVISDGCSNTNVGSAMQRRHALQHRSVRRVVSLWMASEKRLDLGSAVQLRLQSNVQLELSEVVPLLRGPL